MKIRKKFFKSLTIKIFGSLFAIICFFLAMGTFRTDVFSKDNTIRTYAVYLGKDYLGRIVDTKVIENFYKDEEKKIRDENPGVQIYEPANLSFLESNSFFEKDVDENAVIEKLKNNLEFLTDGFKVTVHDFSLVNGAKIPLLNEFYVTDKEMLLKSLEEIIKSFVKEEDYQIIKSGGVITPIEHYGTQVLDAYISNKLEIAVAHVPLKKLLKTEPEIKQFLLYSSNDPVEKHTVVQGETLESIASKYKLNLSELIAVNSNIKSKEQLLNPGEVLNVQLLNPLLKVVGQERMVQKEVINAEVITTEDSTMLIGEEKVVSEGSNGERKSIYNVIRINGFLESTTSQLVSSTIISDQTPRLVTVGTKKPSSGFVPPKPNLPPTKGWIWPTKGIITSGFEARWGSFHYAVDIADNSMPPVYSPHSGTVTCVGDCVSGGGNMVVIDAGGGFIIKLMHLSSYSTTVGAKVEAGTHVGQMGSTGISTGIHLHFQVEFNGIPFDPMTLYPQ